MPRWEYKFIAMEHLDSEDKFVINEGILNGLGFDEWEYLSSMPSQIGGKSQLVILLKRPLQETTPDRAQRMGPPDDLVTQED